jgi:Ca2+-binding EF-hand superfamily protein
MDSGAHEEVVANVLCQIQNFVYPRRLRAKEFFVDYDPLRHGRCTANNFERALVAMSIHLKEHEVRALVEHFTDRGPRVEEPQVVNYLKFSAAVDEVFKMHGEASDTSVSGFRRMPSVNMAASTMSPSASQTFFKHVQGNDEEEEKLNRILERIAALCKTRGVTFKDHYVDSDRLTCASPSRVNPRRGGKVTRPQFIRNFPFQKDFSPDEIEFLAEKFTTDNGSVHFYAVHHEVEEFVLHDMQAFPKSDLVIAPDDAEWSHRDLHPVDKLRAKVVERRVRVYELFQDFDALRKGFVTVGQVKTVFTILDVGKELNREEFELLLAGYLRDDGMFCYTEFCRDVESDFTTPYLEKSPSYKSVLPDPSTTLPARRNTQMLTSDRRKRIQALEDKMRYRVRTRGVHPKPAFQDLDKVNRGYVTRAQFTRVLSMLGFEMGKEDVNLLCEAYCNLGNHTDFNYLDFVDSLDPPNEDHVMAAMQRISPVQVYQPTKYFDPAGKLSRTALDVM